ncbi:MAG: LacI family DNA-binding transcriptional regulator [candidate division KSB1 bacterium]|nr:LacI family DNA-binding transcriptional regulator [candidate division KSB1 bacterium]
MAGASEKPTIYNVATKAGVGIGTVSRALNNSPNISPDTKKRVLKAIEELHYQPHAMARGLARRKSHMAAIMLPMFTGYFYMELMQAIQEQASRHEYDLIMYSIDKPSKSKDYLKRVLQENRVDGIIMISLRMDDKYVQRFVDSEFPVVLVDSYNKDLDSITVKNKEGAYKAACHLIQQGHRRIGMIDAQLKSFPAQIRLDGFKQALDEYGIPFEKNYLVISDSITERDGFNREAGYDAMQNILSLKDRPTAIFVASDIQAAGALQAIREVGLKVPDDIALIGFDDIELAKYLGITTMKQPLFQMGTLAFQRLMEKMETPSLPLLHKSYNTELVIRQTCGAK